MDTEEICYAIVKDCSWQDLDSESDGWDIIGKLEKSNKIKEGILKKINPPSGCRFRYLGSICLAIENFNAWKFVEINREVFIEVVNYRKFKN